VTSLDVVVEAGTFCSAPDGGVTRIYREILPRMCEVDPDLTLEVLVQNPLGRSLPMHSSIRRGAPLPVDAWLRPYRVWRRPADWARRAAYGAAARGDRSRLWHSTSFTVPLRWRGPTVVTVYDMIHERFPELFQGGGIAQAHRRKAQAVHAADRVICISESTRVDVIERYGLDPDVVVTIPLASSDVFRVLDDGDDRAAASRLHPALARPYLLWVGGRHAYKDFERFARVFAAWDGRADLGIVTVGAALTKAETVLLKELDLAERVLALRGVEDEALCRLYNLAVALVYPSRYEGFGIPLLEAMACGCPVVAARIPTSFEVAGDCAVLFEPGDPEDMMHALTTVVADGRGCDRVRRGRERARVFSWNRTARDTVRVYRELARRA
jgi:glycosyltransferase involved in cell wall biosynthesis